MDPPPPLCPKAKHLASVRYRPDGQAVRVRAPNRAGVVLVPACLEALVPAGHLVRSVWQVVTSLDLSAFVASIRAEVGQPGAPATDPQLLLALWLYALLQGEHSSRRVAQHCVEDVAYIWLCGGVTVNYHTLADFRVQHPDALDALFTQVVQRLAAQGLVEFDTWAQDGMRVRASAGASSFHRAPTLQRHLLHAEADVRAQTAAPVQAGGAPPAVAAAQARAARERVARVRTALEIEWPQAAAVKPPAQCHQARVSETDPQARVMKMPDGGFRPAYNWQYVTDSYRGVITGVAVSNVGSDRSQLLPLLTQVAQRYGWLPAHWLVDGGFMNFAQLKTALGYTQVFAPVRARNHNQGDRYAPARQDSAEVRAWRAGMGTALAQRLQRVRGATAEWVNAQARQQHGVQQVTVRGLVKVGGVALWVALAHNLGIWIRHGLRAGPAAHTPLAPVAAGVGA